MYRSVTKLKYRQNVWRWTGTSPVDSDVGYSSIHISPPNPISQHHGLLTICYWCVSLQVTADVAQLLGEQKVDAILCVAGGWAGGNCSAKGQSSTVFSVISITSFHVCNICWNNCAVIILVSHETFLSSDITMPDTPHALNNGYSTLILMCVSQISTKTQIWCGSRVYGPPLSPAT